MTPEEIPEVLMQMLDKSAGKTHSRQGSVARSLAEILTKHEELMTMNADDSRDKGTTPPRMGARTAYDIAVDYAKKARRNYDEANRITNEFRKRAEEGEFGGSQRLADIAASESYEWRIAVQDEQFMERLSALYANIAQMDLMGQMWAELKRTNDLLQKISQK